MRKEQLQKAFEDLTSILVLVDGTSAKDKICEAMYAIQAEIIKEENKR